MSMQLKRMKFEFEPLIKEMLDKIPDQVWNSRDTIFLDPEIGGGQIVAAVEQKLRSYGHSDENISSRVYGISSNKYIIDVVVRRHALVGTYVVGNFLEGTLNDMEFDVGLANPPFSMNGASSSGMLGSGSGSIKLYPTFYSILSEVCKNYAIIMPDSSRKIMKSHNDLIKDTATAYDRVGQAFSKQGIAIECWIIYHTEGRPTVNPFIGNVLKNDLPWGKGPINMTSFKNKTGSHGREEKLYEDDVTIYHKINKTQGVCKKYARPFEVSQFLPKGWLLFMPQTIDVKTGWANTVIVKSNGNNVSGFNGISYLHCFTKEEAEEMQSIINSDSFREQISVYAQRHGNVPLYAFSMVDINKCREAHRSE